jgi:hypothetical protein
VPRKALFHPRLAPSTMGLVAIIQCMEVEKSLLLQGKGRELVLLLQ